MIEILIGELLSKTGDMIIVNCNGVGYGVRTSTYTNSNIGKIGDKVKIHTYLKVSENEMSLYGFIDEMEKKLFLELGSVNGVGAKTAINILSTMQPKLLIEAIVKGDIGVITQAPGIGKKGAQKIILELKDKFSKDGLDLNLDRSNISITPQGSPQSDAVKALIALGYRSNDASIAVSKAVKKLEKNSTTQQIITEALKKR
ncbi:MAG: Holliday junction branch migration protein RuvA [Candidatus Cloacimonadota bacterium]|nr:MAG: Holliday junction branch migration protein RuvA [Candidatus Cloacimonadota bacterium]PIE78402.1 MAG: Holliday junction branch migration protein RuvA [Candidatus Delongbacteria bacterium]